MATSLDQQYVQSDIQTPYMAIYRNRPEEIARVQDLMRLIPPAISSALDIGARDGHISIAIAEQVAQVTALDLEMPNFSSPRVTCVQGDATALTFADSSIDLVFCAEVLEHIPSPGLEAACNELARVAKKYVLIGVPYMQDIRDAKTTCAACKRTNPPWAHVNSFDEQRIRKLFPSLRIDEISFVGIGSPGTNWLSSALMTFAGNPFGTYVQQEPCVHCGAKLRAPVHRSTIQRIATKAAVWIAAAQPLIHKKRGNWIHVRLAKET